MICKYLIFFLCVTTALASVVEEVAVQGFARSFEVVPKVVLTIYLVNGPKLLSGGPKIVAFSVNGPDAVVKPWMVGKTTTGRVFSSDLKM